jgi:hypothetical protein
MRNTEAKTCTEKTRFAVFPSPDGMLFPARESLVSDIPDGDGKIENLFLQCRVHAGQLEYVICREDLIELTVMGPLIKNAVRCCTSTMQLFDQFAATQRTQLTHRIPLLSDKEIDECAGPFNNLIAPSYISLCLCLFHFNTSQILQLRE